MLPCQNVRVAGGSGTMLSVRLRVCSRLLFRVFQVEVICIMRRRGQVLNRRESAQPGCQLGLKLQSKPDCSTASQCVGGHYQDLAESVWEAFSPLQHTQYRKAQKSDVLTKLGATDQALHSMMTVCPLKINRGKVINKNVAKKKECALCKILLPQGH